MMLANLAVEEDENNLLTFELVIVLPKDKYTPNLDILLTHITTGEHDDNSDSLKSRRHKL